MTSDGERLVGRLRDLAQVSVHGLLAGCADRDQLLEAYALDLVDALAAAQAHVATLWERASQKPAPLAFIAAPAGRRGSGDGAEAAARAATRMRDIAAVCRELAVIHAAASDVLPRLAEAERLRHR